VTAVRKTWTIETTGRGTEELTARVRDFVSSSGLEAGVCHVFVHHTSASLILCENADASVRSDLEAFLARLVPDGDPLYSHTAEGPDDMPAHVRSVLTANSVGIPFADGRLDVGTWQGLYLWEHRTAPHRRRVTATLLA